ncbi:MAG: alanine--tRNA ligase [Candidatus Methanomethylicia archaeon]
MINEKEYETLFFTQNSFHRKICAKCGKTFWTLNPLRETCGEAPCEPYEFLMNPIMKYYSSIDELRNNFLLFFKRNGHEIINPYPVVARWRDDIYLTIASIAVFQPFVTSGESDPPANPLVISQPCIRLVDIDEVGKSMKHLTIFEMAAHHAFNYPNKEIYWKDKTVELCHNFMTEVMGVDPKEITYKESWWEGGGNAGPCFEVCIGGLEVATLVFMMYKVVNGGYKLMPLKIVDTGYGLERILWESQAKPTIFHSIYDPILNKILNEEEIYIQEKNLRDHVYKSSIHPEELLVDDDLNRIQNIFALLDYTKCLTFMLADGLVPSNSGGGYLARLLIRRIIRLINQVKIDFSLIDLIKLQINYWGKAFPHILKMEREIYNILKEEEERYVTTLKRGERIIKNIIEETIRRGDRIIPVAKLIELYDSHGIPPEITKEIAERDNVKVEIPSNFYSELMKRHLNIERKHEEAFQKISVEEYPPTRKIYYEDAYKFRFEAEVLGVIDNYVILDSTAFYPEGGGQPCDHGVILWEDKEAKVIDVQKIGEVIVHKIDGEKPPIGRRVMGIVDVERRLSLMRSHTATHLLLAAAIDVLGKHVWQSGAQKDVFKNRLDITHYKPLTIEEIKKIEEKVNTYVLSNIDVKIYEMPRAKAEGTYGIRIYQGGVVPGKNVRLVNIGDINVQACGGLHVNKTGEIGLIKILKTSRIQDGVIRIEFTCGLSSLRYIQNKEEILMEAAKILNSQEENLIKNIGKIKEEIEKYKIENKQLWRKYLTKLVNEIIQQQKITYSDIKVYIPEFDELTREQMIEIGGEILKKHMEAIVIVVNKKAEAIEYVVMLNDEISKRGFDSSAIAKIIAEKLEGKSGGEKTIAQGFGRKIDNEIFQSIICEVRNYVINKLK